VRVLVTGSSRGLGLGICGAFAERGDEVVAVCRRPTPELEALGVEVVDGIELTDDAAVASLPTRIGGDPLDVVVCNAAINIDAPGLDEIVVPDLLRTLDVNALGAVRVVLALLPTLQRGAKIVLVSSGGLSPLNMLTNPSVGNYGYRMSKSALISFGHGLARDVRDRGIAVLITAPGAVNTDQLRQVYAQGRTSVLPETAADPLEVGRLFRARIDELTLEDSPAWQRNPAGEPAIEPELQAQLVP
jgi:NAD(P)-dependent dehydrogenase (short-subunit alcohol dehydrogenase family)